MKQRNGYKRLFSLVTLGLATGCAVLQGQHNADVNIVSVDSGWAANSVNTAVFRKNSLVSFGDTQFIAYYNANRYMVIGKRKTGERNWSLKQTQYQGNTRDAHNVI